MKGKLIKSKDLWYVEYTSYKTIGVVKGIMGSGHKINDIQSLPLIDNGHIDGLNLYDSNEGLEVDFEIIHCIPKDLEPTRGETLSFESVKYAKLIEIKQD